MAKCVFYRWRSGKRHYKQVFLTNMSIKKWKHGWKDHVCATCKYHLDGFKE